MVEKRTSEELQEKLAACPALGTQWRHYRSRGTYIVCGSAIAEASQEPLVLYHPVAEGEVVTFARPLAEWVEVVLQDGLFVPRFQQVR